MNKSGSTSWLLILFVLIGLVGCSKPAEPIADGVLEKSDSFKLYSLNPIRIDEMDDLERSELADNETFQDWQVLGSTKVENEEVRTRLVSALQNGVAENDGTVAACFDPRHGIRVEHDGKTHDFVICFECYQIQHYIDDEKVAGILTTSSPKPLFNKVLKNAEVDLPKN